MDTPVLIVGAGPSGATAALLLAQMGIKSIVISKHSGTANTPRAHIFNQRAMEVLRSAGLEEQLKGIACPAEGEYPSCAMAQGKNDGLTVAAGDVSQICSIHPG
jgi:2-polyprenyl-6-methoxyphenol hydroxylase-like FAD-dependent oxidoreductase